MNDNLQEARLENWYFSNGTLFGAVHGHPNPVLTEGETVKTSTVRYINEDKGFAVTRNTVYFLGKKAGN